MLKQFSTKIIEKDVMRRRKNEDYAQLDWFFQKNLVF